MKWFPENLYWLVPSISSVTFATITLILIFKQHRWQKNAMVQEEKFLLAQTKLQETQISLDLMEKRLQIYQGFKNAIGSIIREGEATSQILQEFYVATQGYEYLFGDDIAQFYKKLEKLIKDMMNVSARINAVISGRFNDPNHSENVDKQDSFLDCFIAASREMQSVFSPYLDFSCYTVQSLNP